MATTKVTRPLPLPGIPRDRLPPANPRPPRNTQRTVSPQIWHRPLWHCSALIICGGVFAGTKNPMLLLSSETIHESTRKFWHERRSFPDCYFTANSYEEAEGVVADVNMELIAAAATLRRIATNDGALPEVWFVDGDKSRPTPQMLRLVNASATLLRMLNFEVLDVQPETLGKLAAG